MNGILSPTDNRRGSVVAIALMVMVTLTIVGLMAVKDTVMESTIARNHTLYRQTLYLAEAAVRQAVQMMEDYTDDTAVSGELMEKPSVLPWMRHYLNFDFGDDANFGDFRAGDYGSFTPIMTAAGNNNASGFVVRYEGVSLGSSIVMGQPTNKYQFSVYGRAVGPMAGDATETMIKVGYTMRY
jgi:hypothetical protein